MVLLLFLAAYATPTAAIAYLQNKSFAEPAFIFVIMVIAASRPVLDIAGAFLLLVARLVPLRPPVAYYVTVLTIGPLLGSLHTEPDAIYLSGLLVGPAHFLPHRYRERGR